MKKAGLKFTTALVTLSILMGALAGCASTNTASQASSEADSASSGVASSDAETSSEQLKGVDLNNLGPELKKISDSGTLIVGNDSSYPPFGFIDTSTNKAIGVEKEMATAITKKLSSVLGKTIKLDFESMNFDAVLSSLSTGKIDLICSCCTVTEERKKVMDFSDPYLLTQDVCLVLKKNKDNYKSLADFKDKKLAANTGSSQEVRARKISKNVTSTPTISDGILQLQAGKVDAIIVDNITAERYSINSPNLYSVELSDSDVAPVDKAVAMQKGNDDLKAIVNAVVKEQTDAGNVQKWVDEYSKKAASMGLNK